MLVNTETLGSGSFETNYPATFTVLRYFNIMTGSHRDFTVQWFHDVGTAVLLTLIMNVLEPHVLPIIKAGFNKLIKELCKRRMVIQYDLNELYTGFNFEPEVRYPQVIMSMLSHAFSLSPSQHCSVAAQVLNTLFVTLVFCGGMPIALPMAMVALIITLYLDKYMILRFYNKSRIEMLDGTIIRIVVKLLPVAIIFHLVITIYIYGCVDCAGMYSVCELSLAHSHQYTCS